LKLAKLNEHIASLCNYNESHIKLVKWFIAHMIKKPHELPPFCLVFISKEGVGKDIFYDLIENLLGEKYTFNVDKLDSIVGKFNATMGGKIFGVVNETDPIDSAQRRDNIKFAVSAKKLNIEGKHKDPVKTKNYCRLTFFANRFCAFPVEKGARRPFVINCSE
jgi:phage/plasmid-associated DNA primase